MKTSSVSFQEALQSPPHLSDYIQGDDHNLATQLCRQHFQPNDFLLTAISLQLSDSAAKPSRVNIKKLLSSQNEYPALYKADVFLH